MKIKIFFITCATVLLGFACTPIEDRSLRDDFEKAGAPITAADLNAALSVTQPIANEDGKVEGDQYVVIHNSRPDVAGVWHYSTDAGEKTTLTDHDTIVYTSNGSFDIWFVAVSEFQAVTSKTFTVEVTNCFDNWDGLFTGAANKADKTASKTWEYWEGTNGTVHFNGMFDNWGFYPIQASQAADAATAAINLGKIHDGLNAWGATTKKATAGDYTFKMEYNGSVITVYKPDGSVHCAGKFSFSHDSPDITYQASAGAAGFAIGTLTTVCETTTHVLPGSETRWQTSGRPWWILYIDEDYMVIAYPAADYTSGDFWDHDCWYAFYKAKK
jgi:hypothetical protein